MNEPMRTGDMVAPWVQPLPINAALQLRTTDCMPVYSEIHDEFKRDRNTWVRWQTQWFFDGLKAAPAPREGVDGKAAMRHLSHIQRSWDTKHEHKKAAVAYLASMWFREPTH